MWPLPQRQLEKAIRAEVCLPEAVSVALAFPLTWAGGEHRAAAGRPWVVPLPGGCVTLLGLGSLIRQPQQPVHSTPLPRERRHLMVLCGYANKCSLNLQLILQY